MANQIERRRRLYELGIIRIGEKRMSTRTNREYPAGRETFRITSANRGYLEHAQKAYGGELRPWEGHPGEFELLTERPSIPVLFSAKPEGDSGDLQSLSQWWEMWGGNTCLRRCDGCECKTWFDTGRKNTKGDAIHEPGTTKCLCDHDDPGFRDLQSKGQACKLVSRVSVILPDIPALGLWRLNTSSGTFDEEMHGLLDLVGLLGMTGLIPMTMSIDWREKRTGAGEATERFPVPKFEYLKDDKLLPAYMASVKPPEPPSAFEAPETAPAIEPPADVQRQAQLEAAHAYLAELGMNDTDVQAFREECITKTRPWVTVALKARDGGCTTQQQFRAFVEDGVLP
jgi:hypothetical protein